MMLEVQMLVMVFSSGARWGVEERVERGWGATWVGRRAGEGGEGGDRAVSRSSMVGWEKGGERSLKLEG